MSQLYKQKGVFIISKIIVKYFKNLSQLRQYKLLYKVIIVLILLSDYVSGQDAVVQPLKTGSELEDCPCDQVKNVKEYKCCCDTDKDEFSTTIIPTVCLDKNYGSAYQIPLFKDLKTRIMSIEDLYNPFRLVYQIIKTLGSVLNRNGAQKKITFQMDYPSSTKTYADILLKELNQFSYQNLPSFIQPEERLLNRLQISLAQNVQNAQYTTPITAITADSIYINIYIRDKVTGNCIPYTATKYETVTLQICNIRSEKSPLYQAISTFTLSATQKCITVKESYQATSLNPVACGVTTANLKTIGFIYTNSYDVSVIFIQLDDNTTAKKFVFIVAKIFFDYAIQNDDANAVKKKPKYGYQIGDPLIFMQNKEVTKGFVFNDIYKKDGSCRTETTSTYNLLNPIEIQFGKNYTVSCKGKLPATFYLQDTTRVGIFPNANPKYVAFDWFSFTSNPTLTAGQNFVFKIYYQKQGKITNPTYRITSALKVADASADSTYASVSVLFYEEPQEKNYYLSKPPEIKAKLPRDVLYPFFTFDD